MTCDRLLIPVLLLVVCLTSFQEAIGETGALSLAQPVRAIPRPRRSFIVVSSSFNSVEAVSAASMETEDPLAQLVVGRLLPTNWQEGSSTILAVSEANDGEVSASSRVVGDLADEPIALLDVTDLRNRINERRTELFRMKEAAKRQEQTLSSVNAEANELLKLERALESQPPKQSTREQTEVFSQLRELAEARRQAIKTLQQPIAFKRREQELKEQLNQMAQTLRLNEQAAREGMLQVSPELKEKLELIESTKDEHIDLLRRELAELRHEREEMESQQHAPQGTAEDLRGAEQEEP